MPLNAHIVYQEQDIPFNARVPCISCSPFDMPPLFGICYYFFSYICFDVFFVIS